MKLLIISILFIHAFAQETNLNLGEPFIAISGIIDRLLEGLENMLEPVVKEVGNLLSGLQSAVSNLVTNVVKSLFDLIDDRISSINDLLAGAIDSQKLVGDCVNRTGDLRLVKQKISEAVEKCRKNLDTETTSISAAVKEQLDQGKGVISRLTKSLQDCLKGLFLASCISKAQQSSLKEIQTVIKNTENLRQRISLASIGVTKCLNDVEENGRQLVNQIYIEIQHCISTAPSI